MTDPAEPPTVAGVFHRMYFASDRKFGSSGMLAGLLQRDVDGLTALDDQPAPDPISPDFAAEVLAIGGHVRCGPAILAELLGQ